MRISKNDVKDLAMVLDQQRQEDFATIRTTKMPAVIDEVEKDGKDSSVKSFEFVPLNHGSRLEKEYVSKDRSSMATDFCCAEFLSQIKRSKENLRKVSENEKDYSSFDNQKEYAPLKWSKEDDDEYRQKHNLVPRERSALVAPLPRNGGKLPKVVR